MRRLLTASAVTAVSLALGLGLTANPASAAGTMNGSMNGSMNGTMNGTMNVSLTSGTSTTATLNIIANGMEILGIESADDSEAGRRSQYLAKAP